MSILRSDFNHVPVVIIRDFTQSPDKPRAPDLAEPCPSRTNDRPTNPARADRRDLVHHDPRYPIKWKRISRLDAKSQQCGIFLHTRQRAHGQGTQIDKIIGPHDCCRRGVSAVVACWLRNDDDVTSPLRRHHSTR